MPLLMVLALMALPFVEVWLMIVVGGWIGVPWTLAALVSLMILGMAVLRHTGRAFREVVQQADEAMRTGEQPRKGLLDPLMLMAGGILLVIPGFLTAAAGVLMVTPITRPALRWAFAGWANRRMAKMQERVAEEFTARGVGVPGQSGPFGPGFTPGGPSAGPTAGASGGAGPSADRPTRGGRVIQGRFEPDDET
ncbi:FxsA family protein [Nocardiopsis sp. NPDC055551]